MFDLVAVAMANDALRRQHRRFEGASAPQLARSFSPHGRVRIGVARRLRAVADRLEPVADRGAFPEPNVAIDRRGAA